MTSALDGTNGSLNANNYTITPLFTNNSMNNKKGKDLLLYFTVAIVK